MAKVGRNSAVIEGRSERPTKVRLEFKSSKPNAVVFVAAYATARLKQTAREAANKEEWCIRVQHHLFHKCILENILLL